MNLIAAQENCYFSYSWGWREQHGSLVDYPEFHKPLGKPKGKAKKENWVYTRTYEHASVWVDLAQRRAKIDWK
ncbi:MAG: putative glycoside hydrolase [Planctomycetota bacterium]